MPQTVRVDAAALDRIVEPFERFDAPGLVVGVALDGIPRYRRGVGLASVELPLALTPSMRLRIGSTTKHFCSLAILLLVEEKLLSLDDSPRRFVPELPDWADAMTLRQLMSHTSGMRDSIDILFLTGALGRPIEDGAQLALLSAQHDVNFSPGERFNYCNSGYAVLTEIVERLSGLSFGAFLKTRILDPVGMHDTELKRRDSDCLPNCASLHLPNASGGFTRGVFGPPIGGEGGMVSTVDDMLRWLAHMANPIIGSSATWAALRAPLTPHGYGLGLFIGEYRGLRVVHHGGTVAGGTSQMLKVVDHDLDIVVLANRTGLIDPRAITEAIIDACVRGLPPASENVAADVPLQGTFHARASGLVARLSSTHGVQFVTLGATTFPVRRDADGRLFCNEASIDLCLKPIEGNGAVTALDMTDEFGVTERLDRVEPPADPAPTMRPGRFWSEALRVSALIASDSADVPGLRLETSGRSMDYRVRSLGPGLWSMETGNPLLPFGGTIEMDEGGFRLSTMRNRRLRFERVK